MEKCRRMKRLQCMSKSWKNSWLWKSSKTRQQYCRLGSFAMKTDILMNGSRVKNHISLKTGFGYNATRRTSFLSWFQACQRGSSPGSHPSTSMTPSRQERHCSTSSSSSSSSLTTTTSSDIETREREDQSEIDSFQCLCQVSNADVRTVKPVVCRESNHEHSQTNQKITKTNEKETMIERWNPLFAESSRASSEIPEWLQEFRENLVDDEVPEHRDCHTSSSHEVSLEPTSKRCEELGKHSVYTHFPKDRNCEICQRTKITRAQCRRRNGGAVPLAENFGDLITADHKVLSDNCESRNNHRYAVVVQDLATQWIQSYPCKNKTSQETQRSVQKFLEPERKPKVIYTDNSMEFGKACEYRSWNHCTSTPHRSETNGIAERTVRRVKEGTSAVLLQSSLNENWWADSMESYTYLRNVTVLLSDGKTPYERRFGNPFYGPIIPFGSLGEYHPTTAKDQSRIHQFGKKALPGLFFGYALYEGRIWKGDVLVADLEELETMDASEIRSKKDSMRKRWYFPKENLFSNRRWKNQTSLRRSRPENIQLETAATYSRRKSPWFFWRIRKVSSTTSRLVSGCQWSDEWFLVHVRILHTAITLNPESNFTRREKNHSQFQWNTLMFPALLIRIWM